MESVYADICPFWGHGQTFTRRSRPGQIPEHILHVLERPPLRIKDTIIPHANMMLLHANIAQFVPEACYVRVGWGSPIFFSKIVLSRSWSESSCSTDSNDGGRSGTAVHRGGVLIDGHQRVLARWIRLPQPVGARHRPRGTEQDWYLDPAHAPLGPVPHPKATGPRPRVLPKSSASRQRPLYRAIYVGRNVC